MSRFSTEFLADIQVGRGFLFTAGWGWESILSLGL